MLTARGSTDRARLIAKPTEAAVVLNTSDAGVLKHRKFGDWAGGPASEPTPAGTDIITDALLPALFGVSEVRLGSSTGGDSTAEPAWRLGANVAIGE